ncbi:MAG: glycoside hydrolase family 3 protein [Bacteroidales bacterium]|nr:glycoside hydrolase family 3 protein [Bacteroidales bacterium]
MAKRIILFLAALLSLMQGLGAQTLDEKGRRWVDSVYSSLTPDERLGQLYMVDLSSKWTSDDPSFQLIEKYIDSCHIGGVIFFYGGPMRQAALHNRLQQRSKVPLMVGIDGEWGLSMRLDSVPVFPRNLTLGALSDNGLVLDLGREIGRECRRMGITVDFMPCVDLYSNLANPVIANRSFGSNKLNVAYKASSIMQGMQNMGVLTTAKHFPGHGNTETDSHEALPIIRDSYRTIDTLDMFPFKYLVKRGVQGVMVGHLLIPAIVGQSDKTPASISPKVISGVLRDSLKFSGLVFTDALQMKGVSKTYETGDLELRAFKAGVDVFLMPSDCIKSFNYMVEARNNGLISQADIDQRCRKILEAKYRMGLSISPMVETENLIKELNTQRAAKLYRTILEKATTLIKNDGNVLPIRDLADKRIAVLTINKEGYGNEFESTICKSMNVDIYRIKKTAKQQELQRLRTELQGYDLLLVGLQEISSYPKKFGMTDELVAFVDNLLAGQNVVLDIFSSPVGLTRFANLQKAKAIVVSYEDSELSREVSAQLILGQLPFDGRLPVSLGSQFREGCGISTQTIKND